MFKTLTVTLSLVVTPALALAGTSVERFESSEYTAVVSSVTAAMGEPELEQRFWDCGAYACENRVAYWLNGNRFVKVFKSLDGRGWIMVTDQGCPPVDRRVCASF